MAPAFRKSIRDLLASVRGSMIMDSPGDSLDDPMKKILNHQHAATWADVAFSNIIKSSDVGHFKKRPRKVFQDVVEHEYIIVHLRYQGKTTFFRIDRSIGPRSDKDKDKDKKKASDPVNSPESGSEVSTPSRSPSSRSGSSMESILMCPARLVDYCVCRLSNITSSRHWAKDTIVQIPEIPSKSDSYELTTIEFTGLSHGWPSLWDLLHIVQFLNQQCEEYNVIDAQCYWYADMVSGILEDWCQGAVVTHNHGWQGIKSRTLSIPAPGTFKSVPIYKRDPEVIRTKKTAVIEAIKTTTRSTLEFLDLKTGASQKIQQISAVAEEQIQTLSTQLRDAELRVREAEARAREAEDCVSDMAKQVKRGEEGRAETRVQAVEDRADDRVSQMAQQIKDAEDRVSEMTRQVKGAEARMSEMAKQMKGAEERAERVERAETKIQELSAQLQRSQELVVGFETRASARDELMERIMARLEERLPTSGNSHSVVA
ncbi:hypothetical protein F5887DRAFT_972653 [Amanita rubescens]|nr:hypothetical protein F5887DRAFT_972653 [Amanita rubescens]